MFRLTLRVPSNFPLELDGITPDRLANLSAADAAKLPVLCGNRREELGEFFDVSTKVTAGPQPPDIQFAGDTRNVKRIGAGMSSGSIYVENGVGMHAGAGMTGGRLKIDGDAGGWLGAEMTGGIIEVRGNVGSLVGAAYRGGRRGMSGGTIAVRGDAGDEVGLLMRRGLIAVQGRCGDYAGAAMIAGTVVAAGGAGRRIGGGMKRGTLLVGGGGVELPPSFRFSCEYRPAFLGLLLSHLESLRFRTEGLTAPAYRCFRGDVLTGGRGELLFPA